MFSAIFIRRPRFAIVISLFLMLAGGMCAFMLPIDEYPQISPPTVMVTATYPGASAQVVADTVAAPLEAEVNGVEDMVYFSSTADNSGNYTLNLTFKSDADANMALVNVNNAVKRAERSLPNEVVSNGIVVVKRSADIVATITFTSSNPEHTPLYLSNYVSTNVKDAVSRIEGVGQAIIFGERKYSMRVWLDPNRMRAMDIGYAEVSAAIASQNVQAATGSVGTESSSDVMQYKIDTRGRLLEEKEFADIIVRSGDEGRQVRLGDIATVELGSESYGGVGKLDGDDSVLLAIFKLNNANALELYNNVEAELTRLAQDFPPGMESGVGYDSTEFIRITMAEIVQTLILTFILVVVITWLFLQDWRATLVPMLAIPVSLMGTFIFLYLLGMSINTLTMFALILVIGSVVDDAICVVESCARLIHEEKLTPVDAAVKTMEQLTGALIATTLVVVAVYLPVAFYGGMVGTIYTQFAVTMCIALCISTVCALTLSPAVCAIVLRDTGEPKGFFKRFNAAVDFARNGYLKVGGLLARRLVLTAILFGAVLLGNYGLYKTLPGGFLPNEDKGAVFVDVVLPSGAALARTQAVLSEMETIAASIPGVDSVISVSGRSMTAGEGENLGMIILDLADWSERTTPETSITAIQAEISRRAAVIPDAAVTAFAPPPIMGLGATGGVSFALQATGSQTAQDLAQATNHLLAKIMDTGKAMYAFTSFDANTPMLRLDLDRAKAEALDVPVSAVFNTLQTQLGSIYVNDFNMNSKTYKVKVQSAAPFRENVNAVGRLHVTSNSGASVPLSALATVEWTLGPRRAERFNMFQSASVNTQSLPFVSSGEMMATIQELVRTELPADYQISWTDMSYQESQNQGQILWLMLLALVFGYLFLVAQYESWTMPVSVILSVATATLGGLAALSFYGQSLNIYCQLGLLMLVGLTAKTTILMVEFAKQEREDGKSIYEAAMSGMRMRFRAVIMTGLSFVIGVAPMVAASGAGAGSRQAIGQTTFWGMLVAMVVGMIFIPGLYVIFQTLAERAMAWGRRQFGAKKGNFSRRIVLKR
ncbi:MAG: efflux RND transporter permease subunit [Planctomycetaceae bacterium]|nr:efflux RND transporter permease subunit [Planctomycetaceae bacterium]